MKIKLLFIPLFLFSTTLMAQDPVDYDTDIAPIFANSCNSCHGNGQNAFNSSSYAAVMASVSPASRYGSNQVIPGDADGSPLVDKIEPNPQFGTRMPQTGPLPDAQIALIRRWIDEGAGEVATSTEDPQDIPSEFALRGNYPNPFNPSTQIVFNSPSSADYQVSIYNIAGVKVAEYSGRALSGDNNVRVAMLDQPTGVYFYRVSLRSATRNWTADGRMTLIR